MVAEWVLSGKAVQALALSRHSECWLELHGRDGAPHTHPRNSAEHISSPRARSWLVEQVPVPHPLPFFCGRTDPSRHISQRDLAACQTSWLRDYGGRADQECSEIKTPPSRPLRAGLDLIKEGLPAPAMPNTHTISCSVHLLSRVPVKLCSCGCKLPYPRPHIHTHTARCAHGIVPEARALPLCSARRTLQAGRSQHPCLKATRGSLRRDSLRLKAIQLQAQRQGARMSDNYALLLRREYGRARANCREHSTQVTRNTPATAVTH